MVLLLGKTGAGKTSLVRCLTGATEAEIGNGFQPCTRTLSQYDFPEDQPLVRFLDTRGLGEAGYDPTEDHDVLRGHSHVIVVVCRLDDPVQGEVAEALRRLKGGRDENIVLVHTAADLIADPQMLVRSRAANAAQIERAAGRPLPAVTVSLAPSQLAKGEARDAVVELLLEVLPAAGLLLSRKTATTTEGAAFQRVRNRVLFYAGLAASTDLAPVVGMVSVPAAQMAMLRELGNTYGVPWTRSIMGQFAGALGLGVGARFAGSYALRQLGKLIPVYGQTVGAAFSGTISFAVTYALGRAAAYYLHFQAEGRAVSSDELRDVYGKAFSRASHAPDSET